MGSLGPRRDRKGGYIQATLDTSSTFMATIQQYKGLYMRGLEGANDTREKREAMFRPKGDGREGFKWKETEKEGDTFVTSSTPLPCDQIVSRNTVASSLSLP